MAGVLALVKEAQPALNTRLAKHLLAKTSDVVDAAELVSNAKPLEEVGVALDVTHAYRGDVEAYLTSPSGTTSRLVLKDVNDLKSDFTWSFTTTAFWGKSPNGTWTVRVGDAGLGVTADVGVVTVGGEIGDNEWVSRDVDLVQIYLDKNQRVTVEVRARRLPVPSTLDSYLRLFSSSGKPATVGVYEMDVQILNKSPRSSTATASTAAFESGIFAAYASYALEGQSKQPARRSLGGR